MRRLRVARSSDDAGFGLVEVMVALGILVVLSIATAPFFYRAFQSEASQGSRQDAVTVAGQRLDYTRAISNLRLVVGRTPAAVSTIISDPGLVRLSSDNLAGGATSRDLNYDPLATASSVAVVPVISTQTVGRTVYTVRTYIDPCYRSSAQANATCTSNKSNGSAIFRISVDVAWNRIPGISCMSARAGQCEFVTTTLRDDSAEPTFDRNVSAPTVTAISSDPTPEHPGETTLVSVTGTNFFSGAGLTSDDAGDTFGPVGSNTGTSVTASLVASSAIGNRTITLANPDGGNASIQFAVTQSVPTIGSGGVTTPTPVVAGAALTFTINGADFYSTGTTGKTPPAVTISEAGAVLSGMPDPTNSVTSETETATLDPTHKGNVSFSVTLTNFDGGTVTFPFSLTVGGTPPVVSRVTPAPTTGSAGKTETFTLTGTGFDTAASRAVSINENGSILPCAVLTTPAATATSLSCAATLNPSLTGNEPYKATVTNTDGTTGTSGTASLTVLSSPTVTAVSASSTPGFQGISETFTLTTTNTVAGVTVSFTEGGTLVSCPVSSVTATQVKCAATLTSASGNQTLTFNISNADGGQSPSFTTTLPVNGPAPSITAVSLPSSSRGGRAATFTITGTAFDSAASNGKTPNVDIYEDGALLSDALVGGGTGTQLQDNATLANAAGNHTFKVVVTNADRQTASLTTTVTLTQSTPTITGFSATSFTHSQNTTVTLSGSDFDTQPTIKVIESSTPLTGTSVAGNATTATYQGTLSPATGNQSFTIYITNADGGTINVTQPLPIS